jgi:hypothetical protein
MFAVDRAKQMARIQLDRPTVLRHAIMACKKGGTVSVPGVYAGLIDKVPMGAFMNKGLTMKTGQTHMMRYIGPLLERVQKGEIDPSFVISHKLPIDSAPEAYRMFRDKQDHCTRSFSSPGQNKWRLDLRSTFYREAPFARSPFFSKKQPTERTNPMSLINAGLDTLETKLPKVIGPTTDGLSITLCCVLLRRRPLVRQVKQTGRVCCIRDQRLYPRPISPHRLPFRGKAGPVLRDPWEDRLRFRCEFLDDTADLRVQGNTRREDLRDEFSC